MLFIFILKKKTLLKFGNTYRTWMQNTLITKELCWNGPSSKHIFLWASYLVVEDWFWIFYLQISSWCLTTCFVFLRKASILSFFRLIPLFWRNSTTCCSTNSKSWSLALLLSLQLWTSPFQRITGALQASNNDVVNLRVSIFHLCSLNIFVLIRFLIYLISFIMSIKLSSLHLHISLIPH